jgi:hypothetical protein
MGVRTVDTTDSSLTSAEFGKLVPPYPVDHCQISNCRGDSSFGTGAYLFREMESEKLLTMCGACAEYVELHNSLRFRRVML